MRLLLLPRLARPWALLNSIVSFKAVTAQVVTAFLFLGIVKHFLKRHLQSSREKRTLVFSISSYMKQLVVFVQLLMFTFAAQAQSFEGTLTYEQKIGGSTAEIVLQLEANRVHITRKEAQVLHYVYQTDGQLMAWAKGEAKPTRTEIGSVTAPKVMLTGQKRLMAGMEAQEFRFTLKDGSEFTGWFTTALKVKHNQLITPIQGDYWGFLPADGVLIQWQIKGTKQPVLIEGKLMDFKAGKLPANTFEFQ
jgi:hypothetical protein